MKKNVLLTSFSLLALGLLLMSLSGGPATVNNLQAVGAPGDNVGTCNNSNCHSSGGSNITVDLVLEILDQDNEPVTMYQPGETYRARVTINSAGGDTPAGYGFQMTSLAAADDSQSGEFQNPDANTQLATIASSGRQFAEHNGPNTSTNTFEVDWVAPAAGEGDVTFYAAGLGVNRNFGTSGDGGDNTTVTLTEDLGTSVVNPASSVATIGPNPISNNLVITTDLEVYNYNVLSQHGSSVAQGLSQNRVETIDASQWTPGMYILRLEGEDGKLYTQKLIKE